MGKREDSHTYQEIYQEACKFLKVEDLALSSSTNDFESTAPYNANTPADSGILQKSNLPYIDGLCTSLDIKFTKNQS